MKKILVLINPRSRSGDSAYREVHDRLEASDHHIIPLSQEERDIDPNVVIEKYKDEIDLVIIGGGDGSVNHALPALVKTQIPLAVMPLGTANNLARTFEISPKVDHLLEVIEKGQILAVDLGVVNGIYFVNVAGLGLSARVNHQVPSWFKKYFGVFAFVATAFQVLRKARPFKAIITADGQEIRSRSWQISVCNGKHYGNGLTIKDTASLVDDKLHCLSTEITNWWKSVFLVPAFFRGKYQRSDDVTLIAGRNILIQTKHPMKIDVDGDIKTTTPAEFTVIPRILKLMVPTS